MRDPASGVHPDNRVLLRRQLGAAARSLLRPRTYLGTVRELATGAVTVACYPLGLVPATPPLERETEELVRRLHPAFEADPATAEIPVVLVHGYVHNRSAFLVMSRALRRAGFTHVHGLNYNPLGTDIAGIAELLAIEVERVLAATGADRCMLVGHSMGGIVARYYTQELADEGTVDTVITLGSPHRGTLSATFGFGQAVRDLRPGSALMRRLEEGARPSATRWVAYYSDMDLLVTPAVNAKLVHPALRATNIRLRDTGHLSALLSSEALTSVIDHLADPARGRPEAPEAPIRLPELEERRRQREHAARRGAAVAPEPEVAASGEAF